jgi:glycosyltransferase involved in cell wall biosynthesis
MRLAVVMPAVTPVLGGVQRFALELAPALEDVGADVHRYHVHAAQGASRPGAALRGLRALVQDHRRARFDAVLSTFHWPPKVVNAPTFGVVHDLRSCPASRSAPGRIVRSAVVRTWAATFVPSDHVAASAAALLGARRTVVIGEGLDHLDAHHEAPPPPRAGIVVIAGRAPHKRARLGLAAAVEARTVVGGGVTVIGDVDGDIPPGVTVLPRPDDATLARAYQTALVAVAPSAFEGFGLSAGEALRAGTPVAYADDGTLGGLVGAGGVGAAPSVPALARATVEAAERADALGRAARAAASAYTWRTTAGHVLDALAAHARASSMPPASSHLSAG